MAGARQKIIYCISQDQRLMRLVLRYPLVGDFHFQCEMPYASRVEPAEGLNVWGTALFMH